MKEEYYKGIHCEIILIDNKVAFCWDFKARQFHFLTEVAREYKAVTIAPVKPDTIRNNPIYYCPISKKEALMRILK